MRLLIVEDDNELSKAVAIQLNDEGYLTDVCDNGADAIYYIDSGNYDLILLDRMLPGMDGLTILNKLRENGHQTPVIMVTAMNGLNDKIDGLDAGADDYIAKPFEIEELKARIRALFRRPRAIDISDEITYANLKLEVGSMTLRTDSKEVTLSKKEHALIEYFMRNHDQILTREQIITKIWGMDNFVEDGNIDTYIYFVRRRLKAAEANVRIKTVHGVGYRMENGRC